MGRGCVPGTRTGRVWLRPPARARRLARGGERGAAGGGRSVAAAAPFSAHPSSLAPAPAVSPAEQPSRLLALDLADSHHARLLGPGEVYGDPLASLTAAG